MNLQSRLFCFGLSAGMAWASYDASTLNNHFWATGYWIGSGLFLAISIVNGASLIRSFKQRKPK